MNRPKTLTKPEHAVYSELYPLIEEIESRLGVDISLLLLLNLGRRLASRGMPLAEVTSMLGEHYDHQIAFNTARRH
jgi:hypothetical protein